MKNLSVALAVFNEEQNLGACLKSVCGWVKEIVIVDGESTDRTVEIAQKFGAKVIKVQNQKNFHINKMMAINECKGEWILQLDADEIVSQKLKNEILQAINPKTTPYNLNQVNGFIMKRKNFFMGQWLSKGGQYPDYTVRLYKKGKGKLPCKSVHEQAVVNGKCEILKEPLLHYPYPNFRHYLEHFGKYTDIFAMEMAKDKIKKNLVQFLINCLIKPIYWFIKTYFRHKGFVDGYAGFVFCLLSSLRFPVSYFKYLLNGQKT
jgi:glycosyltransferase involved in cell wall biosynthesis